MSCPREAEGEADNKQKKKKKNIYIYICIYSMIGDTRYDGKFFLLFSP